MALTLQCDGCGTAIPVDTPAVGRLAPVYYCPACADLWEAHEVQLSAERAQRVADFEAWRREHRATLRRQLATLPDE